MADDKTQEYAEKLRAGCKQSFMGGYSGAEYEAFVHGMDTVCNVVAADVSLANLLTPLPIPMRLPCPICGEIHVDEGAFATKPHHTNQPEADAALNLIASLRGRVRDLEFDHKDYQRGLDDEKRRSADRVAKLEGVVGEARIVADYLSEEATYPLFYVGALREVVADLHASLRALDGEDR